MIVVEEPRREIILMPAAIEHRRMIFEWLACSDIGPLMLGPPTYPETALPTWDQFQADYEPHFFDDSAPALGRCFLILADGKPVGQVSYNDIFERHSIRRVELDIWMKSQACCGCGYGTRAIDALCQMLVNRFGVQEFLVQPSARNARAIRSYEKAGFRRLKLPLQDAVAAWGPNDYGDSVYMVLSGLRPGGLEGV